MTENYQQQLEDGLEYQDFIVDALRKMQPAIIVMPYSSRKYQHEMGEGATGIEIKHDKKYEKGSPNLYIEVEEKSNGDMPDFTPSGIYRDDNSWLYLIGGYKDAYLFSKHQLQRIYERTDLWKDREIFESWAYTDGKKTSHGFCYPVKKAEELGSVLKHFVFA